MDKWVFPKLANPQTICITSNGQIAQLVEQRTENPALSSNISDLTPKTMQTNADKALECRQNADKFYLYYSLHGKGNDITETREWGDFLGVCLTVKN